MSRLKTDAIRNVNASVDGITLDTSGNVAIPNELQLADKIVHTGDTNTFIRFPANDTVSVETGGTQRVEITSSAMAVSTVLRCNSGFVSDTSLIFNSDHNDNNSTNDSIIFQNSGNELARLKGNGRFGIGTNSPDHIFEVESNNSSIGVSRDGSNAQLLFKSNSVGQAGQIQVNESSGGGIMRFFTKTTGGSVSERLRIDSSGRLLLGTTTEGSTNADELTINTASGHGGMTIRNDSSSYGNIYFSDGTSGAAEYAGYFQYDHTNDSLRIGSGADLTLTLDSSHNATLAGRLYISHDLTITGTAPRIILTDTNNNSDFRINVDGGSFQIQDSTNSYANRFVIKSDGKIGIGDSSPQSKLAVSDAGSTADPVIMAHISGSNGGNLGFGLYSDVNSKYTFKVTNNGRVQVNDGIDFSLTSHASGMTSELLSDYEEGTWTPANQYLTITNNNTARYTKVGRLVTIQFDCTYASSPADTAQVGGRIEGLPFTAQANGYHFTPTFLDTSGDVQANESLDFLSYVEGNSDKIKFYSVGNNCEAIRAQTAGYRVRGTVTYMV